MTHMWHTPCQFDKWNCQVFINLKWKIVFKIRRYYLWIVFFLIAIKKTSVLSRYADLIILGFTWNNSDTFRELIQNNTTHFLSEFISNSTEIFKEILPHKAFSVRVHIKQFWHFQRVNTIQYYTSFQSPYHTIHIQEVSIK